MKRRWWLGAVLGLLPVAPQGALGAEGGSGEYLPGYFGFMAGYIPPEPGVYFLNAAYFYNAEADAIPVGDRLSLDVETNVAMDVMALTWVTPWKFAGTNYALGIAQGFGYVDVEVDVPALGVDGSADTFGLSDTIFNPIILGWHKGDLHFSTLLNVYAPTGQFDEDQPVNLSKNYWAVEPMFNATYLHMATGTEFSGALGYTVNFENPTTDYDSGDVLHFDVAIGQYLSKQLKVGLLGYAWIQVTGDSGDGATQGDFKSEVYGIGPGIDYVAKVGDTDVDLQLKWYHEFESRNRLEGDGVYFTASFKF